MTTGDESSHDSPPRRRRWRRRLLWTLAVLVLVPVLLVLAVVVALRSSAVRQAILTRVTASVETGMGVAAEASDFSLGLFSGELVLEDVALRAPGAERPFLTVPRLETRLRLRSLRSTPRVIEELVLREPRYDVGAPFPKLPKTEGPPTVVAEAFRIERGTVVGDGPPPGLERWFSSWRAGPVDATGHYRLDGVALVLEPSPIVFEGGPDAAPVKTPVEVTASGRLHGPLDGPYELEALRVAGSGLEIDAEGTAAPGDDPRLDLRFELDAELAELLDGVGPESRVAGRGELSLPEVTASGTVTARALPLELLTPLIGEEQAVRLSLAGTTADLDADLDASGPLPEGARGDVALAWKRGDEVLADAELTLGEPPAGADGASAEAVLDLALRLLPGRPGTRAARGRLRAPAMAELADGRLEDFRFTIESDDVAAVYRDLATRWPELMPAVSEDSKALLRGELVASGVVEGRLQRPAVELDARWRPEPGAEVTLAGRGVPTEKTGRADLKATGLDLAPLWPALAERDDVTPEDLVLDRLEAGLASDGRTLRLADLRARAGERVVEGGGRVALTTPIRSAELDLRLERPVTGVRELPVMLRLENGVVIARISDVVTDAGAASLEATLPLGSLAALPGMAERLAALPVARSGGPIELRLEAPELDSETLYPLLALDGRDERWSAGLELELAVDPREPAAGRGFLALRRPILELDGRRYAVEGEELRIILADGEAVLEPAVLRADDQALELAAAVALEPGWRPADPPLALLGPLTATLRAGPEALGEGAERLELARLLELFGSEAPPVDARAGIDATVELDLDDPAAGRVEVVLSGLELELEPAFVDEPVEDDEETDPRLGVVVAALGDAGADPPPGDAAPSAEATAAGDGGARMIVARGPVRLTLDDGRLVLLPVRLAGGGQELELAAAAQLRPSWRPEEPLAELVESVELELTAGPEALGPEAPPLDLAALSAFAGGEIPEQTLRTSLRARLAIDPRRPAASEGELVLTGLDLASEGARLASDEPVRFRLADGRLTLDPTRLRAAGELLEVEAALDLAADWRPEDGGAALIEHISARAQGSLQAALLNPFLAGGIARGLVKVDLVLDGKPGDVVGHLDLSGPQAELIWPDPYVTHIELPEVELELRGKAFEIERATGRLNGGTLVLEGGRTADGKLNLKGTVDDVHYRVDYGLSIFGDAELELALDAEGRGRIGGTITVDRGLLRRHVDLDRELLNRLFQPDDLFEDDGGETGSGIELDVDVGTVDGVRLRNNLADMRILWSNLAVRGNLAEPRVSGRLTSAPDGFIHAFGQVVRVDRASLTLYGEPGVEPELDVAVTTSLEDPSVREATGRFPVSLFHEESARREESSLTGELRAGFGQELAGRLDRAIGPLELGIGSDLLVFGETNPGTRLTIGQNLSPTIALAASFALSEEGETTYVLDFHDFDYFPRVTAQVFTTDQDTEGATLQQVVELAGPRGDLDRPRIRRVVIDAPEELRGRRLRGAVGLEKGDRLPEKADFVIAVDVAEHLRERGYPDAEVTVDPRPLETGQVELRVAIEPGPRVRFEFRGDRPPGASRRAIRSIYRGDYLEPSSLEDMRVQTVRALRAQGYAVPEVTVEAVPDDPLDPNGNRTVVIQADGGERHRLDAPRFVGVDEEVSVELEASFAGPIGRAELATGEESARWRVLRELYRLGYDEARIIELEHDGDTTAVTIEPGPRRRVASVEIAGVDPETAAELREGLSIAAGDPARSDRIGAGVAQVERALMRRGAARARVGMEIEPRDDDSDALDVVYRVRDGRIYRLADVDFEGQRFTRERWAERAVALDEGEPFTEEAVDEARRRLFGKGVFRSVVPTTDYRDDGRAILTFELEERARYRFAYGLRWATSEGLAAVIDAYDRNVFGRGVQLGVRARWADDDRSARLYGSLPNVLGTIATLDLFVEGREEIETLERGIGELTTSSVDTTLQLRVPRGERESIRFYAEYRDSLVTGEIEVPIIGPIPIRDRVVRPVLGVQWLRDDRDDRFAATRGYFASVDLSGADDVIGSDFRYLRLLVQGSYYRRVGTFGGRPVVWASSLDVGLAETFRDEPLLRLERFFAGGEYSVRGYEEDSLGPEDPVIAGRPLGGEALFVLNQELRVPLWERVGGVLFVDTGNVWALRERFFDDLFTAAGLGVRVLTPVGIVRADFAFPLDRRPGDDDLQIYLGLGNTF